MSSLNLSLLSLMPTQSYELVATAIHSRIYFKFHASYQLEFIWSCSVFSLVFQVQAWNIMIYCTETNTREQLIPNKATVHPVLREQSDSLYNRWGPQQMRCMTFSAFSASCSLRLSSAASPAFSALSPEHETHRTCWVLPVDGSELGFAWLGLADLLIMAMELELLRSFTPWTDLMQILLTYRKLISWQEKRFTMTIRSARVKKGATLLRWFCSRWEFIPRSQVPGIGNTVGAIQRDVNERSSTREWRRSGPRRWLEASFIWCKWGQRGMEWMERNKGVKKKLLVRIKFEIF